DYIEDVGAGLAADDVQHLAGLRDADDAAITLYRVGGSGALRFKIIHFGAPVPLSDALPMLENLGVRISAEHLLELEMHGTPVTIHDFDLAEPVGLAFPVASVAVPFAEAFAAIWRGQAENDGFNRLVLGARLEWRQVAVLRGYCKYLLQVGLPYSQPYMEEVIGRYPLIAGLLIELFLARFDPRREQHDAAAQALFKIELEALADAGLRQRNPALIEDLVQAMALPRAEQVARIEQALKAALDDVQSLDDDRILRLFLGVVRATLRTGYFQRP
ncbi:Bacterial NAD-glutamate dehydrogenase, partial [mine drainage metagenome]